MLNTLRSKSAGIIMKLLLGLIVISFAVWGVEDVFRAGGTNTLASVGDTDIGIESFRERFNRDLQRAGSQFGRPLTPQDARAIGLDQQVLGDMMAEAALQEQARRMKLGISEQAVADAVMADETFKAPNGSFDSNRFAQVLRVNNLNEPMYLDLQRRLLLRRQLVEGLVGGIDSPAALTDAVYRHQNERRSARYVLLPPPDGASVAAPDETVLRAFFDERKGTFQAPEIRSFTLIALTAAQLAGKEPVTDEALQARYEQDKARLGSPERRTVQRITFPSAEEAKAASDKIKAGTSFEDIAKERNVADADLTLGKITKGEILDKPIADAAFSLPQGQVSEPVQGQFSTVLLRVTAIEPAVVKTFDDVKEELRKEIGDAQAEDKLLTLHDQIEDDRASGMTLAEIATKHSLEVKTFENVDRQGRTNGAAAEIPGGTAVLGEVYQSDVGVENNAVQIERGYVWFDVTKVDPARERTFEEAKNDVLTRWKAEEARKALDTKTAEALKGLQDGSLKLDALASRENLKVQTVEKIDRRGGSLGASAAAQIFATEKGRFGSAPSNDDGRVLFEVISVETPPLDPATDAAKQLSDRIATTLENDLAAQYVQQLQVDLGATVNNQALANVLGAPTDQ